MDEKKMAFLPFGGEDENADPQTTVKVKNPELEAAIKVYAKERSVDNLNDLLRAMQRSRVLVPATFGKEARPIPIFLKDKNQESYLPVYTSIEQVPEKPVVPALLNMDYESVNKVGADEKVNIIGIALNPFTDNLIIKKELLKKIADHHENRKKMETETRTIKLTEVQYHQVSRKQFEFNNLPKRFYQEGQSFVDAISEEKETFLDEFYESCYQDQRMYPYLPEEFSVMPVGIEEDLMVVSVDFPARYENVPCCQRVYLTWNAKEQKGHYYTIEYTENKEVFHLGEITSEGKHIEHGVAPVEGAQLQAIIDLHKESFGGN